MPITHVQRRRRRHAQYSWYPLAEALWGLVAIIATALLPLSEMHPLVYLAVIAPGAFFGVVRVIAGVAEAEAHREARALRAAGGAR